MDNIIEIVIETPKGCNNKYIWDEHRRLVRLKKVMPPGFSFPFDFGMVPGTKAEDGDAIDVLLLLDGSIHPGIFTDARIIGALKAKQTSATTNRNDRLLAVVPTCAVFGHYTSVDEIAENTRRQIELFFKAYNEVQGKVFTPLGWVDAEEAIALIKIARI
jgi:inorganic pyrophosphatase